ncbi:MAG TPA: hypothetical protein VHY56_03735 [Candidatus Binataceae bacterium]|nr:hypothetical protein [Candidatus Binataceae bacterium]
MTNCAFAGHSTAAVAGRAIGSNEGTQLVANGDAQAAAGDYLPIVISYQKAWSLTVS